MHGLAGAKGRQEIVSDEASVVRHDMWLCIVSLSGARVAADDVTLRGVHEVIHTMPVQAVQVWDPRDKLQADCGNSVSPCSGHDRADLELT